MFSRDPLYVIRLNDLAPGKNNSGSASILPMTSSLSFIRLQHHQQLVLVHDVSSCRHPPLHGRNSTPSGSLACHVRFATICRSWHRISHCAHHILCRTPGHDQYVGGQCDLCHWLFLSDRGWPLQFTPPVGHFVINHCCHSFSHKKISCVTMQILTLCVYIYLDWLGHELFVKIYFWKTSKNYNSSLLDGSIRVIYPLKFKKKDSGWLITNFSVSSKRLFCH